MADANPKFNSRMLATSVLLLVLFGTLLALGAWQMQRLTWKEGLLKEIETRRHAQPISVEAIMAEVTAGRSVDYTAMQAKGHFDHAHERYFLATGEGGEPGFFVYTPLDLADGHILLVNRGFVQEALKAPNNRKPGLLDGDVTISGLARDQLKAKPSWFVPDNDPTGNMFFWKDLDAMAKSAGLERAEVLPFFMDADAAPVPGGAPKGGVTQIDLPNNHLGYAATWFGLALALAVIVAIRWRRR